MTLLLNGSYTVCVCVSSSILSSARKGAGSLGLAPSESVGGLYNKRLMCKCPLPCQFSRRFGQGAGRPAPLPPSLPAASWPPGLEGAGWRDPTRAGPPYSVFRARDLYCPSAYHSPPVAFYSFALGPRGEVEQVCCLSDRPPRVLRHHPPCGPVVSRAPSPWKRGGLSSRGFTCLFRMGCMLLAGSQSSDLL